VLAERLRSGDGEGKTWLTRQIAPEPLPASVLFVFGGRQEGRHGLGRRGRWLGGWLISSPLLRTREDENAPLENFCAWWAAESESGKDIEGQVNP
jgi:hypothetical protein